MNRPPATTFLHSVSRKRLLSCLSRPSSGVVKPFYRQRGTRAANVAVCRVVGAVVPDDNLVLPTL